MSRTTDRLRVEFDEQHKPSRWKLWGQAMYLKVGFLIRRH